MEIKEFEKVEINKYEKNYSKKSFWEKLKKVGKKAGIKLTAYAVALYCLLLDDNVSIKEKGMIIGALGYFISPLDLIPDIMAGVGYTDDICGMLFILKKLNKYMDGKIVKKVYDILEELFDDISYEEIRKCLLD